MIAGIEILLGIVMFYIGLQLLNLSESIRFSIYELEEAGYMARETITVYKTILAMIIAGGFFAFIHGIKRILDNVLNAWVKSAIPKE